MLEILDKIQALPAEHRERIMGEYIKMKLRQRKRQGWEEVNNEIRKKLYFSKLEVQSLRQFIPYSSSEYVEQANRYLHKHLFCI